MNSLITTVAAASLLAGAASAQTAAPATEGVTEMEAATTEMTFVTTTEADFLASRLLGTDIINAQDETIGEIEDLIIRNGNELTGLVIGVGGFLGLGERYVVVDPKSVTLAADGDAWVGTANTTREALEAAPEFEYTRTPQ
jgi:hypothetical protein